MAFRQSTRKMVAGDPCSCCKSRNTAEIYATTSCLGGSRVNHARMRADLKAGLVIMLLLFM